MSFWNGPAFLAGRGMPATSVFLGQVTWPEDYHDDIAYYRGIINGLPPEIAAPFEASLQNCERFLVPGMFSPLRIQGCLNSLMMQLRGAGVEV